LIGGVFNSTVQIQYVQEFPEGIYHLGHCFFGSSLGIEKRTFLTPPDYCHVIECPRVNAGDEEDSSDHSHEAWHAKHQRNKVELGKRL
jgi:hypothetical protein